MSQVFENGELHPVYFRIKVTNGKVQYRRAPFDVLIIAGAPHIMPRSETLSDQALTRLAVDSVEDKDMVRGDFAYETLEPIVLDENRLGDGSDDWIGMNAVSNI